MRLERSASGEGRLRRAAPVAVLVAGAFVASACGVLGSDEADAPASPVAGQAVESPTTGSVAADGQGGAPADPAAPSAVDPAASGDDAQAPAPASIEQLEVLWAEERAAVVDRIRSGGYGLDEEGVLTGPGGFELDLSSCPADWSDTEGVGETVSIGYTTARSGNLAPYGYVADGMLAYFDYVNANGGVGGRPIELVIRDDEYKADLTVELVDELIESGEIFSVTTLGYPGTVAVIDRLNDACVPHPFAVTSHPTWGDPLGSPWTTGLQLSHSTEAVLWGSWIKSNLVGQLPVKVAALVRDDAFGLAYESSFRAWAEANPDVVSEFVAVPHGTSPDASVAAEMATIEASDPDVFISMTAGSFCLQAVQEAGRLDLARTAEVRFTSSVCRDPAAYMIPAGAAASGWNIVGGGIKATTDPRFAEEPFIAFTNQTLSAAGLDPAVGFYGTGFATYGWAHVEAMRIASELEGGLTRSNLILAQRAMDLTHPILLDGIRFAMDGAADGFPVEGSNFGVYDAESQVWTEDSPVIDVDGSTPNCPWTDDGC
ncbi:MAG: ABC transporter substrate-binding protein [Actinomycetota bacterium]